MLALACCQAPAQILAQTLARRNLAGSGIVFDQWWQSAVLYEIDPLSFQDSGDDGFGDLKGIVRRFGYLQSLGVDALVLSPFQLRPDFGLSSSGAPFDARYGSEADFDQLVSEATQRRIRILVDLPLSASHSPQEILGTARFWLTRGIAGLRLTAEMHAPPMNSAQLGDTLRQLQRLCATFAGQRVLLWDLAQLIPSAGDAPGMVVDARLARIRRLDSSSVTRALAPRHISIQETSVPLSDTGNRLRSLERLGDGTHDLALARIVAAALLTGPGAPMLYFGQEIGMAGGSEPTPMQWGGDSGFTSGIPWIGMGANTGSANVALEDGNADSLLNWYRRLITLRHTNAALRNGSIDMLAAANPDIAAWVRRPPASATATAPVLVICNLTDRPLTVSVGADLRRLGLRTGSGMMHTLASSTLHPPTKEPPGAVSIAAIALPPFAVYLGELPRQAGLESSPAPPRRSYPRTSP
jgi:hypothetical protein